MTSFSIRCNAGVQAKLGRQKEDSLPDCRDVSRAASVSVRRRSVYVAAKFAVIHKQVRATGLMDFG